MHAQGSPTRFSRLTLIVGVTKSAFPDFLHGAASMRTTLFIAGLIASGLFSTAGEEVQNASLPEIKASIRFQSDSYGTVPDEIELPASTLLEFEGTTGN